MSSDTSSSVTPFPALDEALNVTTNLASFGLLGFGDEGVQPGVTGEKVVEGTKEITGAAAAEEANEIARQEIEQAREQREKDIANQRSLQRNRQIAASRAAGAARRSTTSTSQGSDLGSGGIESDFLGL